MNLNSISELTIYEAENIHTIFINLLTTKEDIVLDMQSIEKIDMVGIQLLISLLNSLKSQDISVEFIHFKESILQYIEICYCSDILGLPHG